jgi:hypothetical protein
MKIPAVLIMLILAACADSRSSVGPDAEAGAARIAVPLGPLEGQAVVRFAAVITAADMDTVRRDLTVGQDAVARGLIAPIRVGLGRKIELYVYSTEDLVTHYGFSGGLVVLDGDTLQVQIALLPLSGALGVNGTILESNETVQYTVVFSASWSSSTHPVGFPTLPHFSGLVGVNHNANVSFWDSGQVASNGIKAMAEEGMKVPLQLEFDGAREHGNAGINISGGEVNPSPGALSLNFSVTPQFPLVTLVCMIAPTPDWFVGTTGVSLMDSAGNWLPRLQVELYPYDAGTDSGSTFRATNQPTEPRVPIAPITWAPFRVDGGVPAIGTFTFTRR